MILIHKLLFYYIYFVLFFLEGYWEEKKCGRVLGLAFDTKGFLYAVDAYYGIYKINVNSGKMI